MISKMAVSDIEEMREDGLNPTVEDIVRLNALALKIEQIKNAAAYLALPRLAFLGRITFREPTVGHIIWIDTVREYCASELSTYTAIDAYALSRQVGDLPDAADHQKCIEEIGKFIKEKLSPFTREQIRCAISYAKDGSDATANEFPAVDPDKAADWEIDIPASIGCGVLIDTIAMGLGISVREASEMSVSRLRLLQEHGALRNGVDLAKARRDSRVADYYITKSQIEERLKNGKQ